MEPQVPRVTLTLPVDQRRARGRLPRRPAPTRRRRSRARSATPPDGAPGRARAPARRHARRGARPGGGARWTSVSDQFIGIDVGGTKIASRDARGRRAVGVARRARPSRRPGRLVDQLAARSSAARDRTTRAVGIGVPSMIEFATGRIRHSVNIPLQDVPLRELLTERLGLPVYVENDASCAALAEAFEDGRAGLPALVMFTVGTGVGGGLVLGGRLYRGATGAAAEVGHTIIGLDLERRRAADPGEFPQAGLARDAGLRAARWTGWRRGRGDATRLVPRPAADARGRASPATTSSTARTRATRRRCAACGSSASGSASGSPTRSTRSTRWRS